jgi:hypothetical protein
VNVSGRGDKDADQVRRMLEAAEKPARRKAGRRAAGKRANGRKR